MTKYQLEFKHRLPQSLPETRVFQTIKL